MSDSKNRAGLAKRRHARVIKVAPVTRAIRSALAISATTLALTASGGVLAANLAIPATTAIHYDLARRDALQPVVDLTTVHDDFAPTSVYASSASEGWSRVAAPNAIMLHAGSMPVSASAGDVADLTTVVAATPGPGGVSGSDDAIGWYGSYPGVTYGFWVGANTVTSTDGLADGAFFTAGNVWTGYTTGDINATGYTWAAGIEVESAGYINDVRNDHTITSTATGDNGQSWGIYALGGGDVSIANNGAINAQATGTYGTATGLYGASTNGDATVTNNGSINAGASGTYGLAVGIEATAYGQAAAVNTAVIDASASGEYGTAVGAIAISAYGDAYAQNTSAITVDATGYSGLAIGIEADAYASAVANNAGGIDVSAAGYGTAIGVLGYSTTGNVNLDNSGGIAASAQYGTATGMYGYAAAGTVFISNGGSVTATSSDGIADGIFASGLDVGVANTAGITATGGTWAAGIEAQSTDLTTVVNNGGISVAATGYYGQAFGIYATGGQGGVAVTNAGGITATGYYSTGIQVMADGETDITNTGGISAGNGSAGLATGIYAATNYGAADITVVNDGGITAISNYGSFGISVSAIGDASSASVSNSGGVTAVAYTPYGYGATGILASGYDDASIGNSGSIYAATSGTAYGVQALAFNGEASVSNSGGIEALGYNAFGAVASSSNGTAVLDNSGGVSVYGNYFGQALVANGVAGATLTNSGSVYARAAFAYGAFAESGNGLAQITNAQTGEIVANGYYGIGVIGISTYGDVSINNAGSSKGYGFAEGVGTFASSSNGDVYSLNTGTAYGYGYVGPGIGMFARAASGDVSVVNGKYSAGLSQYGDGIGILATGATTTVTNYGVAIGGTSFGSKAVGIQAYGGDSLTISNEGLSAGVNKYGQYGHAYGISATSGGDISITNGSEGLIGAVAPSGYAMGLYAFTSGGSVDVDNAGEIQAYGQYGAIGAFVGADGAGSATMTSSYSVDARSKYGTAVGIALVTEDGALSLSNTGSIDVTADYGVAVGMAGYSASGNVSVSNSSDINVYSGGYYRALGLVASSGDGDATAVNSGSIYAGAYGGDAIGMQGYSGGGSVSMTNSGSIETYSYGGHSIGMYGYASAGDVGIDNTVDGDISVYSYYAPADGIFASGSSVHVANAGSIYANGYHWAAGIEAQGSDRASVTNTGSIDVVAYYGSTGYGIFATGGAGGTTVANGGTINVVGTYATGIYASGDGSVSVSNTAGISAGGADNSYILLATGIRAASEHDGANVAVTNSGDIAAIAYYGATGIDVSSRGEGGSASVANSGSIYAQQGNMYGYNAIGIVAASDGYANISNAGSITTVSAGNSYGAMALAFNGDANVTNSSHIDASSTAMRYYSAIGIVSASANGAAFAGNTGSIVATAPMYLATGIQVSGNTGAMVTNSGSISVEAKYAYGISATSGQGDVGISNLGSGDIEAVSAYDFAAGVLGISIAGNVVIDNAGGVQAQAYGSGFGALAITYAGDATISNSGTIHAYSSDGKATGAKAEATGGIASVVNIGNIDASTAYVGATATGVAVESDGAAQVHNGGLITAESVDGAIAIGVSAQAYGDVLVENSGQVNSTDSDYAVAIRADSATGVATVVNSGLLRSFSTLQGKVAISGGDGVQQVANYGDVFGAIITAGGDDAMFNGDGGVWHVINRTTDFGAGEDAITNGTGGTILLSNTSELHTGAGDDAFVNASGGTIVLAHGAIDLDASGGAGNSFVNDGRILVKGAGVIDMGYAVALVAGPNALPLANNGVLDMVDAATDDALTINGNLGGTGSVAVDINPVTGSADQLIVNGSVVGSQSVDVGLNGVPLSAHVDPIQFAQISGDSSEASFVGGHVVGYDDSSFLDLTVNVISQIDPSNADADIFSVGLDVNGLNDSGSLGASVAAVAHGLITSQTGTWRQRMGVMPARRDDQIGLSPWVRAFGDSGSVKLAHQSSNFGSNGSFGYDQSNDGTEFGLNVNIFSDLNIGLLTAKTTGTQRLTGAGAGTDHLESNAFGMYATWIAPNFYIDASYRWLDFDADFQSAGGAQDTKGNGGSFNLEAGYTAWNAGGIAITPEVQYTRSRVGDFSAIQGAGISFQPNGGASTRGRLGVQFSKAMQAGSWSLTPYGSVNAVREFDGESNYTVGPFSGFTSTKGTSAMVELGLGAQQGGFSVTGGANWTDGGALQGVVGGQLVMRYSW
ncbi:hypothetical protein [Cognatiluteimonas telluris]|uniref:hypothetical protein n=1 Tax=Cognatiluteimonas telluris TaxID=1104775 RepID=UPI001409B43A|nr:hypothetical protein [Lysobacter telluris]